MNARCDPRVDACIARAAEFARPVLERMATTVQWLTEGKPFGWKYQVARG